MVSPLLRLNSIIFNFAAVKKKKKFHNFFRKLRFLETREKSKFVAPKISVHFLDLDELTLKIYTLLESDIVFHKINEKNVKNFVL